MALHSKDFIIIRNAFKKNKEEDVKIEPIVPQYSFSMIFNNTKEI